MEKEIEGIAGGNWVGEEDDSEAMEEAMLKMEEVVGEVEERLKEVMGEEIWEEYRGIVGGNGGIDECEVSEGYDSEVMEEAMVKMEEVVGEVEERLKEVMGEEIWERYRGIVGGE